MKIKHFPVVSSNIISAGYDPATGTLEITFSGGKTYSYENVPKEVYEEMWQQESVGKYVAANIGKTYKFKKIK